MKITIQNQGETTEVTVPAGPRLLDFLQGADVQVNAACGGNGTCHKCRVKITEGFCAPTSIDRIAFRENELAAGWRLSCQARPKTNLALEVPSTENLRSKPKLSEGPNYSKHQAAIASGKTAEYALVCDLGSTGFVAAIAHLPSREVVLESHLLNKQVRYGFDVMTRLASAQKLGTKPLTDAILDTVKISVKSLFEKIPEARALLEKGITLAGNSAMTTFLHEWPIDTLATSPFQPHARETTTREFEIEGAKTKLTTLPLLAGFVGGDTVAGILKAEAAGAKTPWMLVDVGTNTEIVIRTERELWFASAPAGPAFEGGNIHKGMRAEPGAISVAHFEKGAWKLETIGRDIPRGICGSGLMDILNEGVKAGIIHKDGYLPEGRVDVTENVGLLADDVREFQLAKSATRTAIDLLIERAGVKPTTIYLAGTFAQHLRLESVIGIGLLPDGIPIRVLGNASLFGAIEFAAKPTPEREKWLTHLESIRRFVELALQDDFQARFVANLNF